MGYDDPTLYPELKAEIDMDYEADKQQRLLDREKRREEQIRMEKASSRQQEVENK